MWLCICSVGSPDLPSPSVDTNLLFPSDSIPPISLLFTVDSHPKPTSHPPGPPSPPTNASESNPINTPISNKTSGSYKYASGIHNRESANYRLAQETSGLFLGAMPPQQMFGQIPSSLSRRSAVSGLEGGFMSVPSGNKWLICTPHS